MARTRLALLMVAVVGAVAPASAAQARVGNGFVGVVTPFAARCAKLATSERCLSIRDLDRMHRANLRVVRWGFRWSRVKPYPFLPTDWSSTDAMVGGLAARGIRVLPVMTGTPRWAGKTYETPPLDSERAREGWREFLQGAVERYGPGGEYWTSRYHEQYPGGLVRPITTWQIWNEPNLIKTFPPKPSPHRYAHLLRISHNAIKAEDRRAKVLLGGMPGYAQMHAWTYLNRLYHQRHIKRHFDAVALHAYSPDIPHVMSQIRRARHVMRSHGDGHTPIWLTEVGWGSAPRDHNINQGLLGQRRMLKRVFPKLVDRRRHWRLAHVFWFNWRDPPPSTRGCTFCGSAGLLEHDQQPKPAWYAFKGLKLALAPSASR